MITPEADRLNSLARRWAGGEDGAFEELAELSRPPLTEAAGAAAASAWLTEVRVLGADKVGYESDAGRAFLGWAIEGVKRYADDTHRELAYAFYAGDEGALDTLYRQTRSDLISSLSSYRAWLPDGAALDIVADFFSDLVQDARVGIRRFVGARGTFLAWAGTVVRNRARNMLRESGKLTAMPEDGERLPRQLLAGEAADPSFVGWIGSALTHEQRQVFALLVQGFDQIEIANRLGVGSPKVSKMLDEIRARVAERMQSGGYREHLAFALDGVRSCKAVKGLLTRLFLRFVAPALIAEVQSDPAWAAATSGAFGPDPKDALWHTHPENADVVREVAKKLAALYLRVEAVAPDHPFCSSTRRMSAEPWGAPIAAALQGAAAPAAPATR